MNTLGKDGEAVAIEFFRKKGYKILEKNYRTPFGEIDIIARERDVVVFIEVKTRADWSFGQPFEAVDRRKREKIKKVALSYMKKFKSEQPARFDVLSITMAQRDAKIDHLRDAFEL